MKLEVGGLFRDVDSFQSSRSRQTRSENAGSRAEDPSLSLQNKACGERAIAFVPFWFRERCCARNGSCWGPASSTFLQNTVVIVKDLSARKRTKQLKSLRLPAFADVRQRARYASLNAETRPPVPRDLTPRKTTVPQSRLERWHSDRRHISTGGI
jgi:hypothetical protein